MDQQVERYRQAAKISLVITVCVIVSVFVIVNMI